MSGWFSKRLGDALVAWEPLGQLEALFQSAYTQAGCPKEMALFIRQDSEGRLHCEVTVYFSPAAMEVAQAVEAQPCAKPSPESLSLVAGAEAAWSALFADREG